jgi:hypothetical protein
MTIQLDDNTFIEHGGKVKQEGKMARAPIYRLWALFIEQ